MKSALAVGLQISHQNGGRVFLIFVADPQTVRLYGRFACGDGSLDFDFYRYPQLGRDGRVEVNAGFRCPK